MASRNTEITVVGAYCGDLMCRLLSVSSLCCRSQHVERPANSCARFLLTAVEQMPAIHYSPRFISESIRSQVLFLAFSLDNSSVANGCFSAEIIRSHWTLEIMPLNNIERLDLRDSIAATRRQTRLFETTKLYSRYKKVVYCREEKRYFYHRSLNNFAIDYEWKNTLKI